MTDDATKIQRIQDRILNDYLDDQEHYKGCPAYEVIDAECECAEIEENTAADKADAAEARQDALEDR